MDEKMIYSTWGTYTDEETPVEGYELSPFYGIAMARHLSGNLPEIYAGLMKEDKLREYLVDLDIVCRNSEYYIVNKRFVEEGVTEQLKRDNLLLWVGMVNSIVTETREQIQRDFIYVI